MPARQPDDDLTPEEQFAKGMEKQNAGDYPAALELFEKAAAQGHAEAQYRCSLLYDRGMGTAADMDKAKMWLSAAAAQTKDRASQGNAEVLLQKYF